MLEFFRGRPAAGVRGEVVNQEASRGAPYGAPTRSVDQELDELDELDELEANEE